MSKFRRPNNEPSFFETPNPVIVVSGGVALLADDLEEAASEICIKAGSSVPLRCEDSSTTNLSNDSEKKTVNNNEKGINDKFKTV